jgi:hypothetical protein
MNDKAILIIPARNEAIKSRKHISTTLFVYPLFPENPKQK